MSGYVAYAREPVNTNRIGPRFAQIFIRVSLISPKWSAYSRDANAKTTVSMEQVVKAWLAP
jgi:hypothetical protein